MQGKQNRLPRKTCRCRGRSNERELADEQGKLNHTYNTMERPVGGTTDVGRVMGLGMQEVCTRPSGPMWLKTKVTTDSRASPSSEEERMNTMGYDGD